MDDVPVANWWESGQKRKYRQKLLKLQASVYDELPQMAYSVTRSMSEHGLIFFVQLHCR